MEFMTIFKDFGFPAVVVGILLWMYETKLEKLTVAIEQMHLEMVKMQATMDDIKTRMNSSSDSMLGTKEKISEIHDAIKPSRR